jgi:hypothetical protein
MTTPQAPPGSTPWWRGVGGRQGLVFAVASGAWLFDNLDQRLFSLARIPPCRA